MRVIVYDLETSGLNRDLHDVIQFAGQALNLTTGQVVDSLEIKVQFSLEHADQEALNVSSYDAGVWEKEAHDPYSAVDEVIRFINRYKSKNELSSKGNTWQSAVLVGYNNHRFDDDFLRAWVKRYSFREGEAPTNGYDSKFLPASYASVDLMPVIRFLSLVKYHTAPTEPHAKFTLESVAQRFGFTNHDAHDAFGDVQATVHVLQKALKLFDKENNTPKRKGLPYK